MMMLTYSLEGQVVYEKANRIARESIQVAIVAPGLNDARKESDKILKQKKEGFGPITNLNLNVTLLEEGREVLCYSESADTTSAT